MEEAFSIAAAGALYPVAFAAVVGLLGGRQPLRRSLAFLAGGLLISMVGFAVIVVLTSSLHLTRHHHPTVAAVIKMLLGAGLLGLAAWTIVKRRHATPQPIEKAAEQAVRDDPSSVRGAFIGGLIVYIPGFFCIASAKALADADASGPSTAVASIACVLLLLAIVEVPIIAFAIAPQRVGPPLQRITTVAKMHSKQLILAIELVAGSYLFIAGIASA